MKKFLPLSGALLMTSICLFAQVPQKMSYQAVIRNANNELISNKVIGMKISVLSGSASGTAVYSETQSPTANANGLVSIEIGSGTIVTGNFSNINWASGPYFIKTETDPSGGTNYNIVGAHELLSVPYALFSANGTPGPIGLTGDTGPQGPVGLTGAAGADGTNGSVGAQGPIGLTGASGISLTWLGTLSADPTSPTLNQAYYNSVNKKSYVFNGSTWNILAQDGATGAQGPSGLLLAGAVAGNTAYWNGTSWIVNSSNIFNNGGNVGIGTSTTAAKLDILGNIKIADGTQGLGKVLTSNASGLATWAQGGWSLTGSAGTVDGTNFFGTTDNVPLSFRVNNIKAGRIDQTGPTFFGYQSGRINTEVTSTAVGFQSLYSNISGIQNTAIGYQSLYSNIGESNTSNGMQALYSNTTGSLNTANGARALYSSTTGNYNSANGYFALYFNTSGHLNTAIGANSLQSNAAGSYATAVGARAMLYANSTVVAFTSANVAIGYEAMRGSPSTSANTGNQNTAVGYQSLLNNASGSFNTSIGNSTLFANTIGGNNSASGNEALYSNTSGNYNTAMGSTAMYSNTIGISNTATGYRALQTNTTGSNNTANGRDALLSNTLGNQNTSIGASSLTDNTTGDSNTGIGYGTLYNNTTGSGNTAVGFLAGFTGAFANISGSNNTFIGTSSGPGTSTQLTNATAIGYNALVTSSNSLVLGEIGIKVGIGVTAPVAFLDVAGNVKITDGTQGSGKVLTSDANGVASWTTPTGWSLTGTGGTIEGTSFIGTTDNTALTFRVNNLKAGRIDPAGPVFLGYQAGNTNTAVSSTAVGYQALNSNTSGANNTANGYQALYNNTTGNHNTASGVSALSSNTTGFWNTANGYQALDGNTTGTRNTALGYRAFTLGTGAFINSTALGYNAQVTASNMVRVGDANVTSINGAVAFTVVSDGRFKKDIQENVLGLPFILKLRPVTYHLDMNEMAHFMKTPDSLRSKESELLKEKVLQTGLIAQEVEKASNELGYDFSGIDKPDNENDYYGLRYSEFTVPLVKAVQEQQQMIALLQEEINQLKAESSRDKSDFENRLKKMEELLGVKAKK